MLEGLAAPLLSLCYAAMPVLSAQEPIDDESRHRGQRIISIDPDNLNDLTEDGIRPSSAIDNTRVGFAQSSSPTDSDRG